MEHVFVLIESVDCDVVYYEIFLLLVGYVDRLLARGAHLSISIVNHRVRNLDFVADTAVYFLLKGSDDKSFFGVENGGGVISEFGEMLENPCGFV